MVVRDAQEVGPFAFQPEVRNSFARTGRLREAESVRAIQSRLGLAPPPERY
jgi:hypothetical protein